MSSGVRIGDSGEPISVLSMMITDDGPRRNVWKPARTTSVSDRNSFAALITASRSHAMKSTYPWCSPVAPPMNSTASLPAFSVMCRSINVRNPMISAARSSPSKDSSEYARNPATAPSRCSMSISSF